MLGLVPPTSLPIKSILVDTGIIGGFSHLSIIVHIIELVLMVNICLLLQMEMVKIV